MYLPEKITPCPIIESNIEVRFHSSLPGDAIIGIVFSALNSRYNNSHLEALPINQIPAEIRRFDPNLKDKPTHIIKTDNFEVHIGSSVFVLAFGKEYPGWESIVGIIDDFIKVIEQANVISSINYIALRFLNFFSFNIFEHINLKIEFNGKSNTGGGTVFRTEISEELFVHALQITNSVHVKKDNIDADGSLIDITTVVKTPNIKLSDCMEQINLAHTEEKKLFFTLLEKSYLESLNPEYDDTDII